MLLRTAAGGGVLGGTVTQGIAAGAGMVLYDLLEKEVVTLGGDVFAVVLRVAACGVGPDKPRP